MKKVKAFAPIVIVIIVLVVLAAGGGTVYLVSKNRSEQTRSNETVTPEAPPTEVASQIPVENWQTYKNDKYKYVVKYPETWYFHKTGYGPPPPTAVLFANVPEGQVAGKYSSFEISVDSAMGRTLDNYEEIASLVSQGYQKSQTTVNGRAAIRVEDTDTQNTKVVDTYLKYGDSIYRLGYQVPQEQADQIPLCERIFDYFVLEAEAQS